MAFVNSPSAKVTYRFRDETGSQAASVLHIPWGTLASVALTDAGSLADLINIISGCTLLSYTVGYEVVEDAPGSAGAGSRVERKGRYIWTLANGLESRTDIPAPLAFTLLSDGVIDLANSDVDAFFNAVLAGTSFCGADGSDLVGLKSAYEAYRASTRRSPPTRRRSL